MPPRKKQIREHNFAATKPTMDQILANAGELNKTSAAFLKTDVETALTFSAIALKTNEPNKKQRNQKNARKGYDSIVRFMGRMPISTEDGEFLSSKLQRLKTELQMLGETF
jgi:hypothetical protein